MESFFVYIMTNKHNRVLYTGVTKDLLRRVYEHGENLHEGFTSRYKVAKLVYFEIHSDPYTAIEREKQIKSGSRERKIMLVEKANPEWRDLNPELV